MRETFIPAPGLSSGELLGSLAKHGKNTFNVRICSAQSLARNALMRFGIHVSEEFLSFREEHAVTSEALNGNTYFRDVTYSDIEEISDAIHTLRGLIPSGDEKKGLEEILLKGLFKEKNMALLDVYEKYMNILKEKGLIDSISLIRKACLECGVIDADFIMLHEYPLSPLERSLIYKLSGGRCSLKSLYDIYDVQKKSIKVEKYRNCYGAPNEVEMIINDIYTGKSIDTCTVAVTKTDVYSQLFFDYALLYDIPVTFGCGIPIINSSPARLLKLYYHWLTDGFFGTDALMEMIKDYSFDRTRLFDQFPQPKENFSRRYFYEALGGIRFTNDRDTNEKRVKDFEEAVKIAFSETKEHEKNYNRLKGKLLSVPWLKITAEELSLPPEEFMQKYARIRRGNRTSSESLLMMLDLSASKTIYDELRIIRSSGADIQSEEMIDTVLKSNVCMQGSEEGKLFVTGIENAAVSARDNMYIAGLSASNYPGSPREDHLILDDDIYLFGEDARYLTSSEIIEKKREDLITLASLSSSLGSKIYVSYSGLNVSELKRDNASSLIFELFRGEYGSTVTSDEMEQKIEKVEYFEPKVSSSRYIGDAYNRGIRMNEYKDSESEDIPFVSLTLDDEYSPTALDVFFMCPRRFMMSCVLGIPEPIDYDPFAVMTPIDTGNLSHVMMEKLADSKMSKEEFLKLSDEYFDRFIMEHPPLIYDNVGKVKEQFLEMMDTAYEMDPGRNVILKEEEIHCVHESGVKIHGYPDRVEMLNDGTCLIVDYKSGKRVKHETDDIITCLQVVIYAYLMEHKGYRVSGCEYRYIRAGTTVTCRYDEDMKNQLNEKLKIFRDSLLKGNFPYIIDDEDKRRDCRYCKFSSICERELTKKEEKTHE